jgi:hypothetical protein
MRSDVRDRLMEIARRALKATEDGKLQWSRISEAPPEFYTHIGENSAVGIRRVGGRRVETTNPEGLANALLDKTDLLRHVREYASLEYLLALTTPERGEIASITSSSYDLDSDEYKTLEALFESAQLQGDAVSETIDETLKVLQEA